MTWDPVKGAPARVENLAFFRGRADARAVWQAFLREHFERLSALWAITEPEQLEVTEVVPLGATGVMVMLRGARKLQGVPVLGQSFEVQVTTDASPLGAGVLTRLDVNFDGRAPRLPATPRSAWVSREAALAAVRSTEPPMGASLGFFCGEACTPSWHVGFRSGRRVTVNALSGAVEGDVETTAFIGPLQLRTWRPGDTSAQPVSFRNANVVDATTGTSLGQTDFADGTHSFTGSTAVSIGLEGAVGSSNPDARRRVFREDATFTDIPLRRSWTPSSDPSRDFGSPDAWAPNSDPSVPFPHATELLYGLLSYWTYVLDDLKVEVPGRLAMVLSSKSTNGIACGGANAGDFAPPTPDPDGNTTWGAMACDVGPNDDVVASAHVTDGDMTFSAGHEYGHTVNNCASVTGAGCERVFAQNVPNASRPTTASQWRFAVSDGENEVVPTFLGNVFTRFLYNNTREGVPFDPDWHYINYTSTTDSFGSPGQGGPLGDCLAGTTCPTGFTCVASSHSWYSVPSPLYWAGTCVPTCTGSGASCPSGLGCTNVVDRTPVPGGAWVCYHSQYTNKFWDSLGDRLVYTLGWREALSGTLAAVGGQSANGSRDIVDGTDNYFDRYLLNATTRYEVTRGFQAVYRGTALTVADDFTDQGVHAAPISIRTSSWMPIWWGNGSASYPRFEDAADIDVVLFRGLAGASYDFEAWLRTATGSPVIAVTRLNDPSSTSSSTWTSTTGSLTTPALPATDWYAVAFWSPTGVDDWEGRARVSSGSDDIGDDATEALPVVHGVNVSGTLGSGDVDYFEVHVPVTSTSLTITATGPASVNAVVFDPSGTYHSAATLTTSSPSLTISSIPTAGHWTWKLSGATGSYTTGASLGCGGSTPGCDTSPGVRTARNTWGDRFAGRLPDGTTEHVYRIALDEYQGVSVSLADNDSNCEAEIRVFAPTEQLHFGSHPVLRWTGGAATTDVTGNRVGVGGFFEALTTGTYEVRVRSPGASCAYYRLQLATTNVRGPSMPAW